MKVRLKMRAHLSKQQAVSRSYKATLMTRKERKSKMAPKASQAQSSFKKSLTEPRSSPIKL